MCLLLHMWTCRIHLADSSLQVVISASGRRPEQTACRGDRDGCHREPETGRRLYTWNSQSDSGSQGLYDVILAAAGSLGVLSL